MTKHIHCDLIVAWANGETIQLQNGDGWTSLETPHWFSTLVYRVKPAKLPDVEQEVFIDMSRFGDLLIYPASPSEANIVLSFDGETNKLVGCLFKTRYGHPEPR